MPIPRREFLGLLACAHPAIGNLENTVEMKSTSAMPAPPLAIPESEEPISRAASRGDPWVSVNKAHLLWNLQQIQARVGRRRVMAVVKGNGYGHGLAGVARALAAAGVEDFLVGNLQEARELRAGGIRGQVLNFGPFGDDDAEEIIRLGITQNLYTGQAKSLDRTARRLGKKARVQIKLDTGLGRFGVAHGRAMDFLGSIAGYGGLTLEGVFTTLTEDPEFDRMQLERFTAICAQAEQRGRRIGQRHAASSAAILGLPESYAQLDLVRPGILLYGLYPSPAAEENKQIELRPALSLACRIAQVKELRPGESVGYHRVFTAAESERVATIATGYSDGYPKALAGRGSVLVGGRRCPVLTISANAVIVRLLDAPAQPGDDAVLIGAQGGGSIGAAEIARLCGTSVYDVVIGLSARLPRHNV